MTVLLCIGMGFSATAVAARLNGQGWRVIGTARGEEGLARIRAANAEPVLFGGDAPSPALSAAIAEATHVLLSAPPGADGDPVLKHHAHDLSQAQGLVWLGYLSTIGVYGDHGGAWVDETTPPRPVSERSRWRLAAEEAWTRFAEAHHITLQIFRLAGIYGPGRNALEKLRAGREQRIFKPEQVFNRIHVDDIAAVVEAGIHAGAQCLSDCAEETSAQCLSDCAQLTGVGVFNVTDDEPAPPQDVSAFAAELLGMTPPPLVPWDQADLSPMARSFYAENKRVRNARMKDVLGVRLIYPTYREGLISLAANGQ